MFTIDECSKLLVEAHGKKQESMARESVHAFAAATLDEAVTWSIEYIHENILESTGNARAHHVACRVASVLKRAHDCVADESGKKLNPVLRLGPGAPYVWDFYEDDL